MKFGLLGPLAVEDDAGERVEIAGTQARTVLAVLLATPGQAVTADAIIDVIWGGSPPASALGTLQSYVSRLRRSLEPDRVRGGAASILLFEPSGYRVDVDGHEVDHRRFEELADRGRAELVAGRPDQAREVLVEALALWRGPALAEYRFHDFAAGLIARLEGRRLAALDDRLAADLALGDHTAVIGELSELVAAHPLQEGFRVHLALALYRANRQADALRAVADARNTLRDELGIDPGRALVDLEAAILAHDQALEVPDPPARPAARPVAPERTPQAPGDGTAPLIGRLTELTELTAALDEARSVSRVVVVEGEPGIGKTRLAEELGFLAGDRGATVVWGRAFEGGAAPALWPWLAPLRALAVLDDGVPGTGGELHRLLSPSAGDESGVGDSGRFTLVDSVAELVRARALEQPLVLVLDDLQWADLTSLELLTSVTARLDDVPLLVVVTVRELDVGRNDELVDALAALTRRPGTRRIQLRGLSADDTATLVVQATGDAVDPALLPQIHGRAEGNPFYITELARLLAAGNPLAEVPSGVRDVVRRRLAQLPDRSTELLESAAVIGRTFDLALLARTARRDLDTCLDDLEPAMLRRLVVPVPDQPTEHRFAHALVREVVVGGMSPLARARAHLRVADAMDDTDDTAEIRAEHLWNAAPVGAGLRAADALERAAHVAIRRRSLSAAERLLERAVPLRRAVGSTLPDREVELRTIELLISVIGARLGQASLIASPLLARGKQLAVETGRDQRLQSLLWVEWAGLDQACMLDRADPIAAELLARAEADDSPLSSVIGHEAWGIHLWHHGQIAEAGEHFDAALRAGARLPPEERSALLEPDQLRLPLPFSIYIHDLMGDWDDPDERYDEAIRLMPDDPYWELIVRNFASWSALAVGDSERCERVARRAVAIDPEGISTFWSMQVRCNLGAALCHQGRLDEGLTIFHDAWATYAEIGLRVNGGTYFAECALGLVRAGRVEEAREALEQASTVRMADSEHYGDAVMLMAEAALAQAGGADEGVVREQLTRARDTAVRQGAKGIARRVEREAAWFGHVIAT